MNLLHLIGLGGKSSSSAPDNAARNRPTTAPSAAPAPAPASASISHPAPTAGTSLETHTLSRQERAELRISKAPPPSHQADPWEAIFAGREFQRLVRPGGIHYPAEYAPLVVVPQLALIVKVARQTGRVFIEPADLVEYAAVADAVGNLRRGILDCTDEAARRVYDEQLASFTAAAKAGTFHDDDLFEKSEIREDFDRRRKLLKEAKREEAFRAGPVVERVADRIRQAFRDLAIERVSQERDEAKAWNVPFAPSQLLLAFLGAARSGRSAVSTSPEPRRGDRFFQLAEALGVGLPSSEPDAAPATDEGGEAL